MEEQTPARRRGKRGIVRKCLRIMMHALAVFMLLVAVVTPVFWVRSRTRDEEVRVRWNSVQCYMGSWNDRAWLTLQRVPAGPLLWAVRDSSYPAVPGAADAWSYAAFGWDAGDPDHLFNFLGAQVDRDPVAKGEFVVIPHSYLLLFCLSVPAWWFWRVRRGRQKRQGGFPVQM